MGIHDWLRDQRSKQAESLIRSDIRTDGNLFDRVSKRVSCGYINEGLTTIWIYNVADEITFEILAGLSEEFGTKRIDISCDAGTGSNPCHGRTIIIRERTK